MSAQGWNNSKEERVLKDRHDLFEKTVLPYLNSAYNLARWLTRNEQDAQDIVQDAFLRALRGFDTFVAGRDARAWILTIVRNCCRTWLKKNRSRGASVQLEDEPDSLISTWSTPEAELIKNADSEMIGNALEELSVEYKEILILREFEELSYKEIAEVIEAPLGTVMSRLSRARRELYVRLSAKNRETRS